LALVLAVTGGTALALEGRNSVLSDDIAKSAVQTKDIAPDAVTTSDTGPVPAASVNAAVVSNGGQLIPAGSTTTILLDQLNANFDQHVEAANNALIAETPGIYAIDAQVAWQAGQNISVAAGLNVDGANVASDSGPGSAPFTTFLSLHALEELNVGDTVQLAAEHEANGDELVIAGPRDTVLSMYWVGPCDGSCKRPG
jgi:hypothetical protein